MKTATLCFLLRDDEICLAMKKVRFGAGKYNGFGGKVGDKPEFEDETIEEGLVREAKEEIGVEIVDYEKRGVISFFNPQEPDGGQIVHVFTCKQWRGEPQESEEMRPEWFKVNEIPYDKMWEDDKYWLPKVLNGENIEAEFEFDKEDKIVKQRVETVRWAVERNL